MALFYGDASALVKLVLDEPESAALRSYLADARSGHELLEALAMVPVDQALVAAAGAIDEPALRALYAIHVCAAADLAPIDAFVTYDERQAAAARLAGLRTTAPRPG